MKRLMMLSLAVVVMLAIMPYAYSEEQTMQPEVKSAFDRLGRKITAEGIKTRSAVSAKDNQTAGAINEAGKKTADAITKAGNTTAGAINRQADAVKNESTATRQAIADQGKQSGIFLFSLIGLIIVVIGMSAGIMLMLRKMPKQVAAVPSVSVDLEISGQKYKYSPEVVDGKYKSPYKNPAGNHHLFSDPADLRRSAMTALKGSANKWLLDQELDAKRLVKV